MFMFAHLSLCRKRKVIAQVYLFHLLKAIAKQQVVDDPETLMRVACFIASGIRSRNEFVANVYLSFWKERRLIQLVVRHSTTFYPVLVPVLMEQFSQPHAVRCVAHIFHLSFLWCFTFFSFLFSSLYVRYRDSIILAAQLVSVLSRAEEKTFNSAVIAQVKQQSQSGASVVRQLE